jgi:hypothetical protein
MTEYNMAFRLECDDEVSAIALDRHLPASSISKRLSNFIDDYRHDTPRNYAARSYQKMRWIALRVKKALSYPQSGLTQGRHAESPTIGNNGKRQIDPS